jgi:hypothetical protein
MLTSDLFKVLPFEESPIYFDGIKININIQDELKSRYFLFLNPNHTIIGVAKKLNKDIILQLEEVKRTLTKAKPSKRSRVPSANSFIHSDSDEELLRKYSYYLKGNNVKIENVYLNNRYGFLKEIQKKLMGINISNPSSSCSDKEKDFEKMMHQEIVSRYINSYTPYRGLLLYHGLGSGKTCTSISLIEGMSQSKKIFVMTPASLQANYRTQMKFCGDQLFRVNQFWKFEVIDSKEKRRSVYKLLNINEDHKLLNKFIEENNGIWLTEERPSNYKDLSLSERDQIGKQIDIMILCKYHFINYNGISTNSWNKNYKKDGNAFDNSVVIIDEAHNFVSRIINKINSNRTSISTIMYNEIMHAENCRVILLTGTPYINNPCELGVLFNLIAGYTKALFIPIKPIKSLEEDYFKKLFESMDTIDIIKYEESKKRLCIYKNPYGFIKLKDGSVKYDDSGLVYFGDFENKVKSILQSRSKDFTFLPPTRPIIKRLPDIKKEFDSYFVTEKNEIKQKTFFQTRIVGMVSYLGDKKELMPTIIKTDDDEDIFIEKVIMSKAQLKYYSSVRKDERKQDSNKKTKTKEDESISASYRFFSRAACNFVFPENMPRPMPVNILELEKKNLINENTMDLINENEMLEEPNGMYDMDDVEETKKDKTLNTYKIEIEKALREFETNPHLYFETDDSIEKLTRTRRDNPDVLSTYSPKFKAMIKNVLDRDNNGCHLIYSTFRTLEGIGLFRMVLLYHGYRELRIVKKANDFDIEVVSLKGSPYKESDYLEDRYFALYTGSESVEQKEIIRNIYNNNFTKLPNKVKATLTKMYKAKRGPKSDPKPTNILGELIQVLMITASGAEGIDLKNTRFVHVMEPYWHHVRINQVIGRARRICSHKDLPEELQTVKVFLYISKIGKEIETDEYLEIKTLDDSKTTDESLYSIMERKRELSQMFLDTLKEVSIDCVVNHEEKGKCFNYPMQIPKSKKGPNDYLIREDDYKEAPTFEGKTHTVTVKHTLQKMTIKSKGKTVSYAVDVDSTPYTLYDFDKFTKDGTQVQVGTYSKTDGLILN